MSELEELKLAYAECSRQRNELLNKLKSQVQPAQRTWVGLTDEERYECLYASDCRDALCAAIAAKLKEKNT